MRQAVFLFAILSAGCGLFTSPESVELRPSDADAPLDMSTPVTDQGSLPNNSETTEDIGRPDTSRPTCGDGLLQPDEVCDPALPPNSAGACPEACDDGLACTQDELVGSPETCDAACQARPIEVCTHNDGCCPAGCTVADDLDCDTDAVCGDGVVSGAEKCDPSVDDVDAGKCPDELSQCRVGQCQTPRIIGAPQNCNAECAFVEIRTCVNGDGCCPPGCDESNDGDCASLCGNGAVEPGEACDGNCPTAADCDDNDACTLDGLSGSASTCDAKCVTTELTSCINGDGCCPAGCNSGNDDDCSATCGNDVLDPGETCDPASDCPTNCDDSNACTVDLLTGSPSNCNVMCSYNAITACQALADGCCPPGCTANNDGDCLAVCGNSIVEQDETCDGNCPASCDDDDVCTSDTTMGTSSDCTLACVNAPITACMHGDGCCPSGCNAINDDDCGAVCGNAITEPPEMCDGNCPPTCNDGNACTVDIRNGSEAQCNVQCTYSQVLSCLDADGCCPPGCNANNDSDCSPSCGNSVVEGNETCDGDCPTAQECASMPCMQLTGNAGSCNAECTMILGCQTCSPSMCNCPADQWCAGGICVEADGSKCDKACDGVEYCEVWTGPQSLCDFAGGDCIPCRAICEAYQLCNESMCHNPPSCDLSPDPDLWCQEFMGGGTCVADKCE